MNRIHRSVLVLLVLLALFAPGIAQARVVDEAGMFSAATISQLDQQIAAIKSSSGRDVLIVTVPSLNGQTVAQAAQRHITGPVENIGGVFVFISKQEKKIDIAVGRNTVNAIPQTRKEAIRQGIVRDFRAGNVDQGILTGVTAIGESIRAVAGTSSGPVSTTPATRSTPAAHRGGGFSWLTLILIAVAVFVVINIIRGMAQRSMGGGMAPGGPGYGGGGPGYGGGGPGYGGGYAGGPGGGGFMSGLLGGLGGAVAGNWLYDRFSGRHDQSGVADQSAGSPYGAQAGSDWNSSSSAGTGWSSDGGGSWGGSDSGGFGGSVSDSFGSDAGFGGSADSGGGDWS